MAQQKDTTIYRNISPLIQQQIDYSISNNASSGLSSTPSLAGALLANGTVALTGNLSVGTGVTIDGVDIDAAISALQSSVAAVETFAYSGLGLSNTDTGSVYTLILTSSSNPGAAAAIIASNSSGGLQLTRLGLGTPDSATAPLHTLASSGPQARLTNVLNAAYADLTVSSAGTLTINNTGATPSAAHLYLTPGAGAANVGIGAFGSAPAAKLEIISTTEQLRTSYSAAVYASHTVSSAGNLTLLATGPNIYTTNHLAHPSYVSQLTNWRISNAGEADFRYIYTDELHAKAFIADLEQALAGGQIISKSVSKIYTAFTVPTAGNTGNLDVEEFAGFAGFHVFVDGDLVRLRQFDRSGGGLKIADIWGTVVYSAQVSSSNPPAQRYVFTRHATYPGTGSGTISAGTLVLDYGTTGNGYLEQNAIDGAAGINSPYYQIVTWATHPKSVTAGQGLQLRVRLGQLRGLTGANQWGLYAGTGWTANPNEGNVTSYSVTTPTVNDQHRYILAGDNGVQIYNADLTIYSSTTPVISLSRTAPSIAVGTGSDTMTYSTGPSGFWVGNNGGTYMMRLGSVSGGALTNGISWDGSRLNVIGSINIGPNAGANYGVSVGNPLLMLRFDGDATGHKGQVAALTGTPYYTTNSKFGKAVVISDAVTNLCPNGDFETNTTGWSLVGTGASMTRITTLGYYGLCSLRVAAVTGSALGQITITSSTSQKTFSAWVIPETAGVTATIGNTVDGSSGAISLPVGVWTKIAYTVTPGSATRTWYIQVSAGNAIYIDGVQLESASAASPFTAVSIAQTGIAYLGGNIKSSAGSFSAWVNVDNIANAKTVFSSDTNGAPHIGISGASLIVNRKNLEAVISVASGITVGVWAMVTVVWSNTTVKGYINGVLKQTATASTGFVQPGNITIGTYDLGVTQSLNGAIDDVFILDTALSDDEIKAIYNSNKPIAINTDPYSLYLYGDNTQGYVRGNATGLFGYSDITGASGTGAFALVTTNSTALGVEFGSVTLNAGDMLLGSAASGKSNLFYDRANGKIKIRVGTIEKIVANDAGALGIKDDAGNNVLLFSGNVNQILRRVDLSGSGSITAGTAFNDVIFDSTGLTLKAPSTYADINSLRWLYSTAKIGEVYSIVDTGAQASGTMVIRSYPYSGGTYGYMDVAANSSSGTASRILLSGTPNNATRGPSAQTNLYNTSGTQIGGELLHCSTAATSAGMTAAGSIRYRMHYRLVVRASGGNLTTLTGDLAVNATTVVTVGATASDFRVGVHSTGYAYWDRVAGAETYEVTFWAIYI